MKINQTEQPFFREKYGYSYYLSNNDNIIKKESYDNSSQVMNQLPILTI